MFIIMIAFATCPAWAQELTVLGGSMQDVKTHDHSYSWQLEFLEGLADHFAFSISYLNEGHVTDHHRDGFTVQAWTRTNVLDRRLSLSAGLGPYYYLDTKAATAGADYTNDHSWGGILSLAATWYHGDRWLFQLRANWVETGRNIDTLSTLLGIGYRLDSPPSPGQHQNTPHHEETARRNEITVFLGRTIVNSFGSEPSVAASIEYRRGLLPYMDWTVSWLHEGENSLIRREGLITQLWAVNEFFDGRLNLGLGGGAYLAVDRYRDPEKYGASDDLVAGIVTLTAGYRFVPQWGIRVSWQRIVTDYNRDTDVILAGIGYMF
jgi:hypothetical protein